MPGMEQQGLVDYANSHYEAPVSDAGGLSDGQQQGGFGKDLLKLLPALAAAVGVGALERGKKGSADSFGVKEALAHFSTGVLSKKLENAMEARKRKFGQEDYLIKKAYEDVDGLSGADLSGIQDVPQSIKDRLAELHQKANEARMNDGVVTGKEAQELIALASPIKAAIEAEKAKQKSPEYQGMQKEKGLLSMATQQARQMPETSLAQAEDEPTGRQFLRDRDEEQIGNLGREIYQTQKDFEQARYDPRTGLTLTPKEIQKAANAREGHDVQRERIKAQQEDAAARIALGDRRILAAAQRRAGAGGDVEKAIRQASARANAALDREFIARNEPVPVGAEREAMLLEKIRVDLDVQRQVGGLPTPPGASSGPGATPGGRKFVLQ